MTDNNLYNTDSLIAKYDLFLIDVWGVICHGSNIYSDVVKNLNRIAQTKKLCFVSNSPRIRNGLYERLKSFGIEVSQDDVYSSGEVARIMIEESEKYLAIKKPVIYEISDNIFKSIYRNLGGIFTDNIYEANLLLVTAQLNSPNELKQFDEIFSIAKSLNIPCLCPNPDVTVPGDTDLSYGPGFIVKNYEGKVIYTGKPYPTIFSPILQRFNDIDKSKMIMIGDTLEMDILGAQNVKIESGLVLTGNTEFLMLSHGITNKNYNLIREITNIQPSIFVDLQS